MDLPRPTQHWGCFDRAIAEAEGWRRWHVEAALGNGRLRPVRRGVYIDRELWEPLDPRTRHLTVLAADQLALGPSWYAARRSAALVYDLPLIGKPPRESQLVAPRESFRGESHSRHRRISALSRRDLGLASGLRVVSPARAVTDIARAEAFRNALVVADAALGRGLPRELLEQCLTEMTRWPGVAAARQVVSLADGRAESALESLSRAGFYERGLPAPELQVEVWQGGRLLGRVDKLWEEFNTVGEDDGLEKFGSTAAERQESFAATKTRQDWLEGAGLEVVRWGWDDAWRSPAELDARLQRAFARGVGNQLAPGVRFVHTTVADRLARAG